MRSRLDHIDTCTWHGPITLKRFLHATWHNRMLHNPEAAFTRIGDVLFLTTCCMLDHSLSHSVSSCKVNHEESALYSGRDSYAYVGIITPFWHLYSFCAAVFV